MKRVSITIGYGFSLKGSRFLVMVLPDSVVDFGV
jgi:hypothetical protein